MYKRILLWRLLAPQWKQSAPTYKPVKWAVRDWHWDNDWITRRRASAHNSNITIEQQKGLFCAPMELGPARPAQLKSASSHGNPSASDETERLCDETGARLWRNWARFRSHRRENVLRLRRLHSRFVHNKAVLESDARSSGKIIKGFQARRL